MVVQVLILGVYIHPVTVNLLVKNLVVIIFVQKLGVVFLVLNIVVFNFKRVTDIEVFNIFKTLIYQNILDIFKIKISSISVCKVLNDQSNLVEKFLK